MRFAEATPRSIEESEEARAFLQARVALFWKVMFLLMAFASVLGALGPLKKPGADFFVDVALSLFAGAVWRLCRQGRRSVRFIRAAEAVGLVLYFSGSSFLGRYVMIGFLRDRAFTTAEGVLMADAYMATL